MIRSFGTITLIVLTLVSWQLPLPAAAQEAATAPLLDPTYHDLARLEGLELVQRGAAGQAPYSVGRIQWMVRDARRRLAADTVLSLEVRAEAEAILGRVEHRMEGGAHAPSLRGWVEAEVGGGESPGRAEPPNGLGGVDVVVNPLWAYRGGRAYGDRVVGAMAGGLAVGPTPWLAFGAAARYMLGRSSGQMPGRTDLTVEALYARAVLGRVALEVGRDQLWIAADGGHDLLLSGNAPPTNMIRLSSDRPLSVPVLGDVDVTLFAADLGPHQNFPHAKQFGFLAAARPTPSLTLRLSLLNKQMGDGAPDASAKDRILDLLWVPDWFRSANYEFSDKLAGLGIDVGFGPFRASAEAALTDFDQTRLKRTFWASAGYRIVLSAPALGPGGRHALRAEATTLGPYLYRHRQFTSGAVVDGFLEGDVLGPDSRGCSLEYAYDDASAGWGVLAQLAVDDRSGDQWKNAPPDPGGRPTLLQARPDEVRVR
ncbi:MAG: capsule assembly Wzi family protein, partial [Gemmatimonadota bacterium]